MKMTDYIKDMRAIAESSGITDPAEMHEILTLAFFKLLKSPATIDDFKQYKLEHYNEEGKTLRIMQDDIFTNHFSINQDDSIKTFEATFGGKNVITLKKDNIKESELDFLKVVKESHSFNEFCEKYSLLLDKLEKENTTKKDIYYYSKVENTLVSAYKILTDVKKNEVDRILLLVEPFGEIVGNHVGPDFIKFSTKNIAAKLDYLQEKETFFQTLSSIDGINFTSFKKFKEAYYNNELEEDSILAKLLSSDNPAECIESIFEGEWFDTYKATTLRSLKKCLLDPTVSEMYEMYPIVDTIVDAIHDKYPYFKMNQNDTIQIKTLIETKDSTQSDMDNNRQVFLDDINIFTLDKEKDEARTKENSHTRVYATSPFGVLMDIGGRQNFSTNSHLSVLYLDEIKMNTNLNDENEMICINRFLKTCEENKIVCAYDGEKLSSRFKDAILACPSVASFDKSPDFDNLDSLLPYKVMIKDMNVKYSEFLMLKKEIPNLPQDSRNDDIIKIFESKLKQQNKLTL